MARKRYGKIKYMVTGAFGDSPEGEFREAFLIIEDCSGGGALIFHPKDEKGSCASIEMAHDRGDGVYVSSNNDDLIGFVNIDGPTDLASLVRNVRRLKYRK